MKRRHFNPDVAPNKRESLEWMRINAERERIFRFKSIAKDTATQYYTILDRFAQELMQPKQQRGPLSPNTNVESPLSPGASHKKRKLSVIIPEEDGEAEDGAEEEVKAQLAVASKRGQNFKQVMSAAYKENQLHNVIRFVTDYLR